MYFGQNFHYISNPGRDTVQTESVAVPGLQQCPGDRHFGLHSPEATGEIGFKR